MKNIAQLDYKKTFSFGISVLLIYFLPIALIWLGKIPFKYRFHLLFLLSLIFIVYLIISDYTLKDLGITGDNFMQSIIWNSIISALFILLLFTAYKKGLFPNPKIPDWKFFFLAYLFILVPVQEFIFRSALFSILDRLNIKSPFWKIAITSIMFCYLHVIYNNPLAVIATLIIGVIWGAVYYKYPNLWGVMFSHSILGITAIMVGVI